MSNWNTQKIKTLKKQWASLTSGRNASDHSLAQWASRAITALDDGEFFDFCTKSNGLSVHQNTARAYERMARALTKVSEPEVWKAVGWDGVRLLCRIEKDKERNSISRWVVTQAKKGPVSETALVKRIEDKAKSYKRVGGPRPPASGSNGRTKTKLKAEVEQLTVEKVTLTSRCDLLKSELTKLIAKWPSLKNDLSPETIAVLGLKGGQLPKVKSA